MDQLKSTLAVLQKYHFWILCGLAVVVSLFVWFWTTANLAGQTEARQKKIDGKFAEMRRIVENDDHPNRRVVEAVNAAEQKTAEGVRAAWRTLYRKQKSNNQLPAELRADFKTAFQDVVAGRRESLSSQHLSQYQRFIGRQLPKLFEPLDLLRTKGGEGNGEDTDGNGGAGARQRDFGLPQVTGVVKWDEGDRKRITDPFLFDNRQPSTAQVLMAQEDLWVYQALVRVISNTNAGKHYHSDAVVREITTMQIGRHVPRTGQNPPEVASSLGEAGTSGSGPSANLDVSRYVDDQGMPLPEGSTPPYYKHPFEEFKMMPIRMELVIKQKEIPKLLVECCNSTMPIETRRFRLRPGQGSSFNVRQASSSGDVGQRPAHASAAGRGGAIRDGDDDSYVPIEIEGIICIYNPPEEDGELDTYTAAAQDPAAAPPGTTPAGAADEPPPGGAPTAETPTSGTGPATPGQPPTTGG